MENELMSWDDIKEEFEISEKQTEKVLKAGELHCDNFWTPHAEQNYDEKTIKEIIARFKQDAPGTQIQSLKSYQYTEFFLDTKERHQLKWTIISELKKSQN